MVCTDRQLTPAQISAGFGNQRAGVLRAVRPFSGDPSGANLMDYINRELFPAMKQGRDKLNEIFLQVADNAPSANPLAYYFATAITGGDPTSGRVKLDNATQRLATIIRVSELNSRLVSAVAWLNVMSGSSTSPIGVVTLSDAINPGRFVRFNLNTITDQGTYRDLGVTVIESSHDNPFVDGGAVVISFIAGVASGGVVPAPGFGLNAVNLVTMAANVTGSLSNATNTIVSGGSIFLPRNTNATAFSLNNVSWFLSSNSLLGHARIIVRAGTLAAFAHEVIFGNTNDVTWNGTSNSTAIPADGVVHGVFADYAAPRAISAGTTLASKSTVVFADSNAMSFGLNGQTMTGNFAGPRGIAGSALSTLTNGTLVFANLNGVSFGLNGSTMTASVGAAGSISAGTTRASLGEVVFSNSNNVSFGLNGATVTATATLPLQTFVGAIAGGTQTATSGTIVFSDSNGMSFGLSGSTRMTGNFAGARAVMGSDAVSSLTNGTLVFSNLNGVSFGLNGSTMTASVGAGGAAGSIAVPGTTFALGQLVFSNSNLVSFGIAGSTLTAQARLNASHPAGQSADVSRLAHLDGGGIVWSLSTNPGVGTWNATVLAIRGISAGTTVATTGTVILSNQNNISFGLNGQTITATMDGVKSISAGTTRATNNEVVFSNSNGVTFGLAGNTVTASVAAAGAGPNLSWWQNAHIDGDIVATFSHTNNSLLGVVPLHPHGGPFPGNMTLNTLEMLLTGLSHTSTQSTGSYAFTLRGAIYTLANSTQLSILNSFSSTLSSTSQSFSARNNMLHGQRLLSVHSSQWSAQPVLSAGINYWFAWAVSTAGINVLPVLVGMQWRDANNFKGRVHVSQSAVLSTGHIPFLGVVSTGAPPLTIGTAGLVTNNGVHSSAIPWLMGRDGVGGMAP